jgi:hypothetical protein
MRGAPSDPPPGHDPPSPQHPATRTSHRPHPVCSPVWSLAVHLPCCLWLPMDRDIADIATTFRGHRGHLPGHLGHPTGHSAHLTDISQVTSGQGRSGDRCRRHHGLLPGHPHQVRATALEPAQRDNTAVPR